MLAERREATRAGDKTGMNVTCGDVSRRQQENKNCGPISNFRGLLYIEDMGEWSKHAQPRVLFLSLSLTYESRHWTTRDSWTIPATAFSCSIAINKHARIREPGEHPARPGEHLLQGSGNMIFNLVLGRSAPEQWAEWLEVPQSTPLARLTTAW